MTFSIRHLSLCTHPHRSVNSSPLRSSRAFLAFQRQHRRIVCRYVSFFFFFFLPSLPPFSSFLPFFLVFFLLCPTFYFSRGDAQPLERELETRESRQRFEPIARIAERRRCTPWFDKATVVSTTRLPRINQLRYDDTSCKISEVSKAFRKLRKISFGKRKSCVCN